LSLKAPTWVALPRLLMSLRLLANQDLVVSGMRLEVCDQSIRNL